MKDQPEKTHLSMAAVQERGWTAAMIRDLLGGPDLLLRNPMYRSAAPMKMFLISRIEEIEKTEQFTAAMAKAQKRRDSAMRVADAKRQDLLAKVEAMEIKLPVEEFEKIQSKAIESFNERAYEKAMIRMDRGDYDYDVREATADSDRNFLDRITVNYIRHRMTRYERSLSDVFGKVGVSEAKDLIRARIYREIAKKYPNLADECERQRVDRL